MGTTGHREFVSLKVASLDCAIDIARVQEINRQTRVTHVDQAPVYVAGIVNLRGQVVTVVDLRARLGLEEPREKPPVYTVLVQAADELVGLLVDDVDDIVAVEASRIKSTPPHLTSTLRQYIDEVVEIHDGVMAVLAIDRVTASESEKD